MNKDISDIHYRVWPTCLIEKDDNALADVLRDFRPDDWKGMVDQAVRHQVVALLYWRLKDSPLIDVTPQSVLSELHRQHVVAVGSSLLRQQELHKVLSALATVGVRPVIFKGAVLAHTLYPTPACRSMIDVDLWVMDEEISLAWQSLEALGYRQQNNARRHLEMQRLNNGEISFRGRTKDQGIIELHWGAFPGEWFRQTTRIDQIAVRQRTIPTTIAGMPVYMLSPEDSIIQLTANVAINSNMSTNSLRSLLDIALLAQREIDWDTVVQRSIEWKLATVVGFISELVTELFGLTTTQSLVDDLRLSVTRRWLLNRFVDGYSILDNRMLSTTPLRFFYLLGMVDHPGDAMRLLTNSIWPDSNWLEVRYGQTSMTTRMRHAGSALTGRI